MRSNDRLRAQRTHTEQQWHHFVQHNRTEDSSWLTQSWRRSAPHVSVNQTCAPIDDPESVRREFIRSQLYQIAQPLLNELQYAVEDSGFAIGLSDAHATLQWTASHRVMARRLEKAHFMPSARWDEHSIGTNAVAIAAHHAKPIAIFSAEHYVPSLHEWVCYAAPIIHAPTGQLAGVLDISAPWQNATPLALATVSHYAQQISQLWSQIQLEPNFQLNVCGQSDGLYRGQTVLPKRLQEIWLVLSLHPEGLNLERLHAYVYGDQAVSMSTLKSEISHLRQHVGDVLQARPYRLNLSPALCATDVQLIEHYALHGLTEKIMSLYQRPVLPQSQAPAIVEYREYLHQLVIRSLIKSTDTEAIWQFTLKHEADFALLSRLTQLLPANDGRLNAVQAKLAQLD